MTYEELIKSLGYLNEYERRLVLDALKNKLYDNKKMEHTYNQNIEFLKNYPYIKKCFPSFQDLKIRVYYCSESVVVYYNKINNEYMAEKAELLTDISMKHLYFVKNELNVYTLEKIAKLSNDDVAEQISNLNKKRPLYFYFENIDYFAVFSILDLRSILNSERIVFFFSKPELENFFLDYYCAFPDRFIRDNGEYVQSIREKRGRNMAQIRKNMYDYYESGEDVVLKHINEGKPKILFFSFLHGYSHRFMQDFRNGFNALGYTTDFITWKSPIHLNFFVEHKVEEFKPDIIISCNEYEHLKKTLPKCIVIGIWVCDPMIYKPHDRCFVIKHVYFGNERMSKLCYSVFKERLVDGLILADPEVFKDYVLAPAELEAYTCDVAMIIGCIYPKNCAFPYIRAIGYMFKELEDTDISSLNIAIDEMIDFYVGSMYREEKFYFTNEEQKDILLAYVRQFVNVDKIITETFDEMMKFLLDITMPQIIATCYRYTVCKWMIESEFNVKIWSMDKKIEPEFERFSHSYISDGADVSKVYNAAKITVGNTLYATGTMRLLEATLSGCMYIGNSIPEKFDYINTRNVYAEDELILYSGKKDLYNKIRYYLDNEEERRRIVNKCRNKIIQTFSYENTATNVIKKIKDCLNA